MSTKMKYEIAESEITIATAPERRIGRRPHLSTIYQGGMVDARYVKELMPVIRMAFLPAHPACSNTKGA